MASNTIGSLSIEVLANIANMVSDLGKAQRENEKAAREFRRQWDDTFEGIRGGLETVAGLLGVGFGVSELTKLGLEAIETSEKIQRMSISLGASTETLQTMQYTALTTGANLDDATSAFVKLEKAAVGAASGGDQQIEAFRAIGISADEVARLLKHPDELIQVTTEHLAGMADGSEKTAVMLELFGRGAAQNSLFLKELGSGFEEAQEQAREFGLVLDTQQNAALARANDALDETQARIAGLGNQIGVGLSPAVVEITGLVNDLIASGGIQSLFSEASNDIAQTIQIGREFVDWLGLVKETFQDVTGISSDSFGSMHGDVVEFVKVSLDEWERLKEFIQKAWVAIKLGADVEWTEVRNIVIGAVNDAGVAIAHLLEKGAQLAQLSLNFPLAEQMHAAALGVADFVGTLKPAVVDLQSYKDEMVSIETRTNTALAANQAWADSFRLTAAGVSDMRLGLDEFTASLVKGDPAGNAEKLAAATANLREGSQQLIASGADATRIHAAEEEALRKLSDAVAQADAKQVKYNASIGSTKSNAAELTQDLLKWDAALAELEGKTAGPYVAAEAAFNKLMLEKTAQLVKMMGEGLSTAAALEKYNAVVDAGTAIMQQSIAADVAKNDVADDYIQKLIDQNQALGAYTDAQRTALEVDKLAEDAIEKQRDLYGKWYPSIQEATEAVQKQKPELLAQATALKSVGLELSTSQKLWGDWVNIISRAGDQIATDFTRDLVEGGDVMASLADVAKQTVEAILAYFAKLAIINPLLNSIFGASAGGGSLLPTLGNFVFGGGTSGAAGAALDFTSTAGGQTSNSIMSPSSWISAGKSLWNGFFGAGSSTMSFSSNMFGSVTNLGGSFGGSVYQPTGLGNAAGIAGGLYAGYNAFNNAGGGGWGLAAGAAYGLGTIGAAGVAGSLALGGTATTGMAGAMAGIGMVPIVGWIAAAAMILDMVTGGGLFGTEANKFQKGQSDLTIGPDGASVSIGADYKGKKPLWGGSFHEWKTIAPTQEQIESANGFYKALLDQSTAFARQFGLSAGEVASGTFRQEFDKKGNITSSKSIVNGVEYKDEDQQQFSLRLAAESYTLDLKKIGVDVTAYTAKFIQDAEAYAKAVQDVGGAIGYAQRDIKNGIDVSGGKGLQGAFDITVLYQDLNDSFAATYQRLSAEAKNIRAGLDLVAGDDTVEKIEKFLRTVQDFGESLGQTYDRIAQEGADLAAGAKLLTGQDSIEEIEAFIREMQKGGETLAQTYQRLAQASETYRQFVGQFEPQPKYVDDFEAGIAGVNDQMLAYIKQANEYAKAAGLQGASTQDLINIQKWAITQQNEMLRQLESSAQSTAFGLGLTTVGTLDEVNSEIARLKGLASSGASAVSSFGSAMQDAARQATDAMNLLLGDLSPLNDQDKLKKAMEGLRAGTVSQEQVLEIGRRLYASSEAYNQLFRQVQGYGGKPGGSSPSGGSQVTGGLTAADSARLAALLKQQQELQAADQLTKYQTLAQQIAEIASFKGQDWRDVLASMKVDIAAFEKGLGLNDQQTADMIRKIMESKDSAGNNTTSIVNSIDRLGDRLERLLATGDMEFHSPGGRNSTRGTMSVSDAEEFGAAVARGLNRMRTSPFPIDNRRNGRAYSP